MIFDIKNIRTVQQLKAKTAELRESAERCYEAGIDAAVVKKLFEAADDADAAADAWLEAMSKDSK